MVPDLAAAQIVADHIGTIHHEIKFTIQEGLDAIKDVIYNLETYDVTTVRATPMWLMARVIKSMGIKWCFQEKEQMSYLGVFVFSRPMHKNLTKKMYVYDCLRQQKFSSVGIEGRVPFWIKNLWMSQCELILKIK
jgi:asparagine synthase (glutamine-hydrolysing)